MRICRHLIPLFSCLASYPYAAQAADTLPDTTLASVAQQAVITACETRFSGARCQVRVPTDSPYAQTSCPTSDGWHLQSFSIGFSNNVHIQAECVLDTRSAEASNIAANTLTANNASVKKWSQWLSVAVQIALPVIVLKAPITKGGILSPTQIDIVEQDVTLLGGRFYTDASAVTGLQAKRHLPVGTILAPGMLAETPVITRGVRLQLESGSDRVSVSTEGIALNDAIRGQSVRVRNLSSGLELDGIAVGPQRVRVP